VTAGPGPGLTTSGSPAPPSIRLMRVPRGLAIRLLISYLLMLGIGAGTAGVVALLIGPSIFGSHLEPTGATAGQLDLIDRAFEQAVALSIAAGAVAACLAAAAVGFYRSRKVAAAINSVIDLARTVGSGEQPRTVPTLGLGPEIDQVITRFNDLACRLSNNESTRRRMLTDLSHEMRTPIATLDGYLEGLDDGVVDWDEQTSTLLREQTARLGRLATDIRDMSAAEEGRLTMNLALEAPADLARAAAAVIAERCDLRDVEVIIAAPEDLPEVSVDRVRMGQVLGNLVDNAVRHTPVGGQIVIRAQRVESTLILEVIDTGEGIEPEDLPHLTERFYRAGSARDRVRGGTGVGLTIASAIVASHGGTLTISSRGVGLGATATVALPLP
jgi:two-component system sensor histidine kinase BaeS